MCTVTYIPHEKGILLTSSRDEQVIRPPAEIPAWYRHDEVQLLYPRDPQGGGTWIAVNRYGSAAVLLNGAFEKHTPQPPYRMSRGVMAPGILCSEDPPSKVYELDFSGIEPFTLVLWHNPVLTVYRWDGRQLYTEHPDIQQAHIWSSATLYDPAMAEMRRGWFRDWLTEKPVRDLDGIFSFHREGGNGDTACSIQMNRNGVLRTVSITGLDLQPAGMEMRYLDTVQGQVFSEFSHLSGTLAPQ